MPHSSGKEPVEGNSRRGKQHESLWSLARMAARASRLHRCRSACADRLSRLAGEDHRPDRSRRQLRSGRSATCRRPVEADGPSLRCREQAGRRHRRRHASRKPDDPDGDTLVVGGLSTWPSIRHCIRNSVTIRGRICPGRADLQIRLRDGRPQGLPQGKLQDIVAAAKASPGSISVATAGVGTGQHLVAAAFMKAAGVKFQDMPYKGFS